MDPAYAAFLRALTDETGFLVGRCSLPVLKTRIVSACDLNVQVTSINTRVETACGLNVQVPGCQYHNSS